MSMSDSTDQPLHIVVIGAGFAGLEVCKKLRKLPCRVTLIDRQNHHLFQPLLYQVATAGLSMPDIAISIRHYFDDDKNITVLMDEVTGADLGKKEIYLDEKTLSFDRLVVATGAVTNYFGNDQWAQHAIGLKNLHDAFNIKQHVLKAFEKAENTTNDEERRRLMTIAIVGGGPAGVEMAGSFAELTKRIFKDDFRGIDPADSRIVLIHSRDKVLNYYEDPLPDKALKSLRKRGVEVLLNTRVTNIDKGEVCLGDETIYCENIIWTAGVKASPITETLGVPLDKGGRISVAPDCSLPGHPDVFAAGDCVDLTDANGVKVPGVSPGAMQMGRHIAGILKDDIYGNNSERPPFKYFDKGMMATIGRSSAVASFAGIKVTGFLGWLMWLFVHLLYLVGFRNKLFVLVSWFYAYLGWRSNSRIIVTDMPPEQTPDPIVST